MAILAQVLHVVSCGAVDLELILAWEPESFTTAEQPVGLQDLSLRHEKTPKQEVVVRTGLLLFCSFLLCCCSADKTSAYVLEGTSTA